MSRSAIIGVDITVKKDWYTREEITLLLVEHFKEWCFQEEAGSESGYLHWQVRGKLKEKKRISKENHIPSVMKGWFTPTKKINVGNYEYCSKDKTRVAGPWKSTDVAKTRQIVEFEGMELRPWQATVAQWVDQPCNRTIDIVYDKVGNCGKSIFSEWMESTGETEEVPPYRDMTDIMQWVATRPVKRMYVFDMPRGMKKDKLADFYSGIECIKNGVAYDKRYAAKKVRFDRPRVVVFTNTLPVFELLSKDRWNVVSITEQYEIVPWC